MVMALWGKSKKKTVPTGTPMNVFWVTSPKGAFYNFLNLEPDTVGLEGASGVYVIWHGGLRPEWLYVGHTENLARAFRAHRQDDNIRGYGGMGGLFVTWSQVKPEYQAGVVRYLLRTLAPVIENPEEFNDDDPPIPVFPPGVRGR